MAIRTHAICSATDWTTNFVGLGSAAARDFRYLGYYTTITAWEAANCGGATTGDTAIAELYGTIDETGASVVVNYQTFSKVVITSAPQHRHRGLPDTGAKVLLFNAGGSGDGIYLNAGSREVVLSYLDLYAGTGTLTIALRLVTTNTASSVACNIVRSIHGGNTGASVFGMYAGAGWNILNNIVYDLDNTTYHSVWGIYSTASTATKIIGNTVFDVYSSSYGGCYGIRGTENASTEIKNNLVKQIVCDGAGEWCYTNMTGCTTAANGGDDATSPDGASFQSLTINFTNSGTGDFSIASSSSAIVKTGGSDLGAVPAAIDVRGRDRDFQNDTWSLGAFQIADHWNVKGDVGASVASGTPSLSAPWNRTAVVGGSLTTNQPSLSRLFYYSTTVAGTTVTSTPTLYNTRFTSATVGGSVVTATPDLQKNYRPQCVVGGVVVSATPALIAPWFVAAAVGGSVATAQPNMLRVFYSNAACNAVTTSGTPALARVFLQSTVVGGVVQTATPSIAGYFPITTTVGGVAVTSLFGLLAPGPVSTTVAGATTTNQPSLVGMLPRPYSLGAVTLTNGSATVTGSDTTFPSTGKWLAIDGESVLYQVQSIVNGTTITLTGQYQGETGKKRAYSLISATTTSGIPLPCEDDTMMQAIVLRQAILMLDSV
jgi:hypothetical protein